MSYFADDIRRIAKQKNPKGALDVADIRIAIAGSTQALDNSPEESGGGGMVPPLTLEILTYDDTQDVDFKDTSDVTHTFKTAATAQITDDNGVVYAIDSITYAIP